MQPTPRVTRRVAEASAPSSEIESGRGLASRLSPTQSESNNRSASTSRAMVMSSSTVVAPKNTPRCGSVNPNERACGLMTSLLEVPVRDHLHHEEIVLAIAQHGPGARQAQVGGAHHPHEGAREPGVAPYHSLTR